MPHPDVIHISDVLARVAELEMCGLDREIESLIESSDATELVELRELLDDLRNNSLHPPPWDNSDYPKVLIRADHFAQWCADACDVESLPEPAIYAIQRMYARVPFDGTIYYYSSRREVP